MPTLPASALSAQHFVTATQYNNLISAISPMLAPWFAATPVEFLPVSGRYEALAMVQASARHNYYLLLAIAPSAHDALFEGNQSGMAYTLISFDPNLLNYKFPSASGTWNSGPFNSALINDGKTGVGANIAASAATTATITGSTYWQWDLGAIVTGTLYWQFKVARDAPLGASASAALRVSNNGVAYTLITAYSANAVGPLGSAGISAGVPMRYIQLTPMVWGIAGSTGHIEVGEIAVYTSSGVLNVASAPPIIESISASQSGGLIALYTTAPTPIAMTYYSGSPMWRI